MRRPVIAAAFLVAAALLLVPESGFTQDQSQQVPMPPGGFNRRR